jgi:hypothetical protein
MHHSDDGEVASPSMTALSCLRRFLVSVLCSPDQSMKLISNSNYYGVSYCVYTIDSESDTALTACV